MEQKAPLYGGPPRGDRPEEGCSGGSTYEAFRKQLRSVVTKLEFWRQEVQDLRYEVEQLRAGQQQQPAGQAQVGP